MDFDDALEATSPNKTRRCTLCRLIASLPEEQAAKVTKAISSDIDHSHIARALGAMTGDPSWNGRQQMVGTHRRGHV